MTLKQYQIDAFADKVFGGNPAAVVPLREWLDDALLQAIADENNLSETAFFVPSGDRFGLRWFTPRSEVDLCGHATLAAAYALFEILGYVGDALVFETRSGLLTVRRRDGLLEMDFPVERLVACPEEVETLERGLGTQVCEAWAGQDYLVEVASAEVVRELAPDMRRLGQLARRGVIVTARGRGDGVDFVSRFFAPKYGIDEDPVTGSAHCALAPYWAGKLGRTRLVGRQVSRRGGTVLCELRDERVLLAGRAALFSTGEIYLGD